MHKILMNETLYITAPNAMLRMCLYCSRLEFYIGLSDIFKQREEETTDTTRMKNQE